MASKTQDSGLFLRMLALNDPQAINILYRKHHRHLSKIIYSLIRDKGATKDILQELFVTLWERRHTVEITISMEAYLIRSAVHRSYNFVRDRKRHPTISLDSLEMPEASAHGQPASASIELEELRRAIDKAVQCLNPKSKTAFTLKSEHNMSYQEIAANLGISSKAVEKRLAKALKHLRGMLKHYLKSLFCF